MLLSDSSPVEGMEPYPETDRQQRLSTDVTRLLMTRMPKLGSIVGFNHMSLVIWISVGIICFSNILLTLGK